MVQDVLIQQYATSNKITVTDAEVERVKASSSRTSRRVPGTRCLKSRGLTETDVKAALREQIILDRALAKDVNIKPSAIQDYFNKNHATFDTPEQVTARHILVPNLAEAQKVEQLLKSGQSFADGCQAIFDRSRQQR